MLLQANSSRLNKITPGEFIPPSPNTPSNAVPGRVTKSSPRRPPMKRKFSENVRWKIINTIAIKIGIPNMRCVRILSAKPVRLNLRFFYLV